MISVLPGGKVVVKAPEGMPMRVIKAFLRDHAGWIAEKKTFMSLVPPRPQIEIKEGGKLWLAGVQFPLHFVDEGCDLIDFDPDVGFTMANSIRPEGIDCLREFYRVYTRTIATTKAEKYAKKWDLQFNSIRVTGAMKRWGSCSVNNNLNFSLRLAMIPYDAIEYVVVHELAHTRYHDHSPEFWRFVERMFPEYDAQRRWLKKNSFRFPEI